MEYIKIFFINTALLITLAYLANLVFKHTISHASEQTKQAAWIIMAIFAGWLSSFFGYRLDDNVIFDLRYVPLIISAIAYPQPLLLILIGVSTGLLRFTFGINAAAGAGMINLSILGLICAALSPWIRRSPVSMIAKGLVVVLTVNFFNAVNIIIFGVIPFYEYVSKIMPITFPAGMALSILFALIARDFHLEHRRMLEIEQVNALLSEQTNELHKNKIILEERAKQLMLASQYKSEFLANMSHELRTPLNGIINLSELIAENDDSIDREEIQSYGSLIHRSGKDLLLLINDILDLSKVEAGKLEIVHEEVNVSELPAMLFEQFDVVAKQRGLDFTIKLEEGLPETMVSDPQRMQQILRNLLSNAFKFTHKGGVSLTVRREKRRQGAREGFWIVWEVKDTGIGIAKDKHLSIFEAFQQADGTISRQYGGTGLGLSISRDLARLIGGFITLQSQEGKGSAFSLYLPAAGQDKA
ncbi:sensor histidine kinase [Paenibacillus rhizophilus]|uniref:Circadian input-output histidine kinase CikA n=1 Tax=Paenibacillus rhizophilus TaxID=1850366 RepID=A0A3N9NZP4_9BACL|nr:ATP-binding protein [Paenibacillus rhizophilus]RQW09398.1 sensor histidine kinase [Paenibacillus rhizophilus]